MLSPSQFVKIVEERKIEDELKEIETVNKHKKYCIEIVHKLILEKIAEARLNVCFNILVSECNPGSRFIKSIPDPIIDINDLEVAVKSILGPENIKDDDNEYCVTKLDHCRGISVSVQNKLDCE